MRSPTTQDPHSPDDTPSGYFSGSNRSFCSNMLSTKERLPSMFMIQFEIGWLQIPLIDIINYKLQITYL